MLNTNFRRLALALIVPVAGLGIVAALSRAVTAQVPEDLKTVARQRVSQVKSLPLSSLSVVNSGKVEYSLQGKSVFDFKVIDQETGVVYGITLDSSGQELSSARLQASEQAAVAAQNGKLAPGLAKKLASTTSTQPRKVMLWLKEPAGAETQRPAPTPPGSVSAASAAQVNAFFAQVDTQRAAAVKPLVDSVATKLRKLGSNVRTEKHSPVVYATLTPDAITQAAALEEVVQVYEDRQVQPAMEVARNTIFADTVNSRGFTGLGVQVAQIEVGGNIAAGNPYLSGTVQDSTFICSSPDAHAAAVAGMIRSTHPTTRGIAPSVSLWAGGSCGGWISELQDRSTAAADWGARVFNLSLGADSNLAVDGFARFYDDMVINRSRTVVIAAGNEGFGNGNVLTPAVAYNVISVGNFDDKKTPSWYSDLFSNPVADTMNASSSWRDPISTHSDREKPEVSAPGTNINSTINESPWIGPTGSGTSYSAPMVTGTAALLIQRNSSLASWPEAIKAILMTTAVHNIEGSTRLSEFDGAGGIVADRADDVVSGVDGTWGGQSYSCSAAPALNVATMSLTAGVRTRATVVWNNNPAYVNYTTQPSADLDIQVVNSSGQVVSDSSSFDNTYEIVDFTPSTSGSYSLRVNKHRCDYDPRWLGWAWRKGD